MLRRLTLVICLIVVFAVFAPVSQAIGCNTVKLSSDLAAFSDQMKNSADIAKVLADIDAWTAQQRSICVPGFIPANSNVQIIDGYKPLYIFKSDQFEGGKGTLGPLDLPGGLYKASLVVDGAFSGKLEQTGGDCYLLTIFDMFAVYELDQHNTIERAIYADGCTANINVEQATGSWTLEIAEYLSEDVVEIKNSYSSETDGTMPIIGPVVLQDGHYNFTLKTEGDMIMTVQTLVGDCQTEQIGRFINVTHGQASGGVSAPLDTLDCVAFITTDNATAPWTLTVQTP